MFERILRLNIRYRWVGLLLALALAALGMSHGLDLPIRLSLADLLPENRESVVDLNAVSKEVGGVGYLIVLVGPKEHPEQDLPKIAAQLKENPEIRYTFYEREEYSLRDRALYLLPEKDFEEVLDAGKIILNNGKRGLIDLGLETERDRQQNLRRAKARLKKLGDAKGERFFLSADKRYAMLLAKPTFDSEDLGRSTKLVEEVGAKLKLSDPGLPLQLVGRYIDKVNDTKQIERDIGFTSWISLVGVALALIFGLGSVRGSVLTVLAVSVAMAWTLGAARLLVGQINILTGFLLAILGGLGVEYGVHLIRRYYQELTSGHSRESALEHAYLQTGRALGSAAITSAAAFLILSFSDFRGFSELGKIAGVGVLSIYLVYLLVFPAMVFVIGAAPRFGQVREIFSFYPIGPKLRWVIPPFLLLCLWGAWHAEFEYDFKRMHNLSKETRERNQFVNDIFGRSFTPAAILAKDLTQARQLESWLRDPLRKEIIQDAISIQRVLPRDMADRLDEIERVESRLGRLTDQELSEKSGMAAADVRQLLAAKPYTRRDLPPQLNDAFGKSGFIVLAYAAKDLDQAANLRGFASLLAEARAKFPGARIGSDVRIFAEILDHITHDGVIILLVFLAGAFFVMGLDFRNLLDALDLELQLITGIFLLVAFMGLVGVRFSILNIAMVPAVLGAGIDMGVHVRHREREGFGALPSARFVAQAVQLSALTTIIGFGSLFFAEAGMLKGIAWISVLGQLAMYIVCMVIWPVYRGERVRSADRAV
ncbi:MAG: RND family transporter [Bacteriovoracia bacterium]